MAGYDGANIEDGWWVRVFGSMKELAEAARVPEPIILNGIASTVIHEKAMLVADAVEASGRPRYPYLYELPGD